MKLGQNMDLGQVITRILGPLVIERDSLYTERAPDAREVQTVEKRDTMRPVSPKDKKSGKAETCACRCQSRIFHFPRLSLAFLG